MQTISDQDQDKSQLSAAQIWAKAESSHAEKVMAKHGNNCITADDLLSVKPAQWLTDQVCY